MVAIAQLAERSFVKGVVGGSNPLGDPMSYKKRKIKRSKINILKYKFSLFLVKFFNKIKSKGRRKRDMRLIQVRNMMDFLRSRNKALKQNSLKINEWVDGYLEKCMLSGDSVSVLMPWCLSKSLEKRFSEQGGKFVPTKKEKMVLYDLQSNLVIKNVSSEKFRPSVLDVKSLWEILEVFQNDYLGSMFILTKDESWGSGLFINVPLATKILEEFYEDFSSFTGCSFAPKTAVYLLGNETNVFWQKIKNNHYLIGLLLGFGRKMPPFSITKIRSLLRKIIEEGQEIGKIINKIQLK